jgi:oligosaccharide repeat unit polymerase
MHDLYPYLLIFSSWVLFGVSFHVFSKRLFHPAVLLCLLWAILFSSERFLQATILPDLPIVSLETYLLIFFVLACFFAGGLLPKLIIKNENARPYSTDAFNNLAIKNSASWVLFFFIGVLLIGLPLYVKSIFSIQEQSANENFWVAVRSEIIYGEMDIGPTKYLVAFSVVTMGIAYYLHGIMPSAKTRILLVLSGAIALVYNLLYTGRTSIFLVLAVLLGVRSFFIQKNPFKVLLYISLIFILLFSVMGILYEKGGSTSDTPGLNAQNTAVFAGLYLVGPLHGLNHHIQKNEAIDYSGEHTLNFFLRTGENIGLLPKQKPREIVEAYVFMPYPTNVYTAFRVYLRDFGVFYLGLMFFLFGCLHAFLFEKARATRELRYVLYYAFLLFPLLLSFFRDQYMTVFSSWLKIIFYIELFLFLIQLRSLMEIQINKKHMNDD